MKKGYSNTQVLLFACAFFFGATAYGSAGKRALSTGSVSGGRHEGTEPAVEHDSQATAGSPPQQAPAATTSSVARTYHYKTYRPGKGGYDNTLKVEDQGGGKLHISLEGAYMYRANGAETFHEGDGEGEATMLGNRATGSVLSGDSPCRVVISFEGDKARVKMGNDCDNNFYILDGTYIKEKARRGQQRGRRRSRSVPGEG